MLTRFLYGMTVQSHQATHTLKYLCVLSSRYFILKGVRCGVYPAGLRRGYWPGRVLELAYPNKRVSLPE